MSIVLILSRLTSINKLFYCRLDFTKTVLSTGSLHVPGDCQNSSQTTHFKITDMFHTVGNHSALVYRRGRVGFSFETRHGPNGAFA
jgi:hypothetical protein